MKDWKFWAFWLGVVIFGIFWMVGGILVQYLWGWSDAPRAAMFGGLVVGAYITEKILALDREPDE